MCKHTAIMHNNPKNETIGLAALEQICAQKGFQIIKIKPVCRFPVTAFYDLRCVLISSNATDAHIAAFMAIF